MLTIALLAIFLVLIYLYIYHRYSFWSRRGVPGPRPIFPLGYQFQKAFSDPIAIELEWTARYGTAYGVYTGLIPTLTITDPELIKQVLVKDFHLFMDRRVLNSSHRIWNQNLFNIESTEWKRIRSITSPTFSTGKLKAMVPLMNHCVQKLVSYVDSVVEGGPGDLTIKKVITGFTFDVIALSSFATETNANGDRAQENPFVLHGMKFFQFNSLRLAAVYALPRWILQPIGIKTIFADKSLEFFVNLSKSVIQNRRYSQESNGASGKKRNDLLQLMMDAFVYESDLKNIENNNFDKLTAALDRDDSSPESSRPVKDGNKKKANLSEEEIMAQCMIFMVAGYETTAATLSHSIFQLVKNPTVQDRLFEELTDISSQHDVNSEAYSDAILNRAPFLDAVIKETLRMYPPVIRLERRLAVDNYRLGGIPLEKNVLVEIPTIAVHYDSTNWPEPESFKPERFLPENRHQIVPYTYLPFGAGPRNCIGMRFAFQEIRLCLARLVTRYSWEATEGTPERLQFLNGSIMLNSTPFPVKVSKRE